MGEGLVINLQRAVRRRERQRCLRRRRAVLDFGSAASTAHDFGEGNGTFDYDPDRATWIDEDLPTRIEGLSADDIATQRIYMDVGTKDEFGFARHYDHFVAALQGKGLTVRTRDGFDSNCANLPAPTRSSCWCAIRRATSASRASTRMTSCTATSAATRPSGSASSA